MEIELINKAKAVDELETSKREIEKLKKVVEEKDKEIEVLRNSKFELQGNVEQVLFKIEKADFIIFEWIEEYGFYQKPDPLSSIKYSSKVPDESDIQGRISFKWYYDYNRIFNLIDIASDYIYESRKALTEALN